MRTIVLVFLGAGFGGVLRHYVNLGCGRLFGAQFPVGVMCINISGSLAMGLLAGYFAYRAGEGWPREARLFLMTGVLGGYTTFSAFSLDAVLLVERGDFGGAALYVAGSVGFSLGALVLGLYIARALS
jgi:fluoride exporter